MAIENEEDLVRWLNHHKKWGFDKLKELSKFKNDEAYDRAWKMFVMSPLRRLYPEDSTEKMKIFDIQRKIESPHKAEWIEKLQNHHNKKETWAEQERKRKEEKDNQTGFPPK